MWHKLSCLFCWMWFQNEQKPRQNPVEQERYSVEQSALVARTMRDHDLGFDDDGDGLSKEQRRVRVIQEWIKDVEQIASINKKFYRGFGNVTLSPDGSDHGSGWCPNECDSNLDDSREKKLNQPLLSDTQGMQRREDQNYGV